MLYEQEAPPELGPRLDIGAGRGGGRLRRRNPDNSGGVIRDMSYSRARVRRVIALPQLTALLLSLGLGFELSACPPGMDMGMEMSMSMDAASRTTLEHGPGEDRAMDCPFGGSLDAQGRTTCPLAVGGIGPCGTSASAPAELVTAGRPLPLSVFTYVSATSGHADFSKTIQLPPPRA